MNPSKRFTGGLLALGLSALAVAAAPAQAERLTVSQYGILVPTLPYAVALVFAAVCVVVFRTQRYIWRTDMRDKAARTGTSAGR